MIIGMFDCFQIVKIHLNCCLIYQNTKLYQMANRLFLSADKLMSLK